MKHPKNRTMNDPENLEKDSITYSKSFTSVSTINLHSHENISSVNSTSKNARENRPNSFNL